jgi:hypothetical protein
MEVILASSSFLTNEAPHHCLALKLKEHFQHKLEVSPSHQSSTHLLFVVALVKHENLYIKASMSISHNFNYSNSFG